LVSGSCIAAARLHAGRAGDGDDADRGHHGHERSPVQGAADQLVSGLRLAQATAIAQRRAVYVGLAVSPAALTVCLDAACTQPLPTPAGDATWLADAGDLKLSGAASFSFAPDGSPSIASTLQVQVLSADGSRSSPTITLEMLSGHVHSP
jgi:Tfp pilus assembly protein FimT